MIVGYFLNSRLRMVTLVFECMVCIFDEMQRLEAALFPITDMMRNDKYSGHT